MPDGTCTVDGCDREIQNKKRGLCKRHYLRWFRHGDPTAGRTLRQAQPEDGLCTIDGCERPAHARGWCGTHYVRWRMHGDPNYVKYSNTGKFGPEHPAWAGDDCGIQGVHGRVFRERGRAKDHFCANCGEPAKEWAYDHQDPNEKISPGGYPYSLDIDHYEPLCWPCHRRMDLGLKPRKRLTHCHRGHEFDEANTYVASDGRRRCRACANLRESQYRKRKRVS